MGVFSEINLFKPANGAFVPGSIVSGIIKYAVDEETVFNKITLSLKGIGRLKLHEKKRSKNRAARTYIHNETYVDTDEVIHDNEVKPKNLPVGSYETQFNFTLPQSIPPSLDYHKNTGRYIIKCKIKYYIRIKFDRPGFLKFAKRFKKDLTVISVIIPRLPMVPTICGEQKELTQWFSSKKSIVNIKSTIEKCVFKPGDTIHLTYEVFNDTNVKIKGVKTKLVEKYKFTSHGGHKVEKAKEVENTDSKTGVVNCGNTQNMNLEIVLPSDLTSLDHSKMVTRDYFVVITVVLPIPHRNAVLNIPVQIGFEDRGVEFNCDESPPSYWEAMGEHGKNNDSDSDDEKA